jgi:hypothetical protein
VNQSRWIKWLGVAVGVGTAMAVALDDVAVGTAIGAAIATVMAGFGRGRNCPIGARRGE